MNFSVNQVRHLYVANKVEAVTPKSAAGTISFGSDDAKSHMYFKYMGAGGQMRSDLIDIKDIMYVKATSASEMAMPKKKSTIVLDSSVSATPVAGQDYIVRIVFRQYMAPSDEHFYLKYGVARAYKGMTAVQLYNELAISLFRNFSRELAKLVEFEVGGKVVAGVKNVAGVATLVDADGGTITPDETGIVVKEVEQEWRLGVTEQVPVYFTVIPTTIEVDGEERVWGKITDGTDGTIGNGKKIADLEYWAMGERGDVYRAVNFPRNIPTVYLVDPTKEYHSLDIHYAYVGPNEGPQKSEKTLTIVSSDQNVINTLIQSINTATGLSVDELA